ncbi:TPA: transketolase family protein [Streptococcus equi subsp. zooepidemicus]|uniref:transketolase family protein n=1 Tax=Streptococcus equi TaxID=1336 RepID=UPI0013F5FD43|nr:transketolase C-terminal domain-containing protein [Streptococcus equi]MCD3369955.1 transketolase family protein [Streptococcus equi subsp. zooepidemicus]MCD3380296.1 transketolase family protein [Streptococcus equi subsp. zooepidemicus]MCD3390126.1 transketolase family protein [Streptococcus equi subsp. zooepidemicus]MDI5918877.1 transketolase C-terminal domain-containing protein [Streptococcus equi subsp. zooepidemicus]MDI5956958.1 transketolase C-terminal domain-containing protein [Strep
MTRASQEMRHVYRDFLIAANQDHPELVVLEADLSSSMATNHLDQVFGKRYVNVGIMEAEMVGLAAGLAIKGYKPYLHTFGPFASRRVFDQLFISLGYAQLSATVIGSDAGVSAEMNGGTHMPFEDLGLLRLIPKAIVYEVSDDIQFKAVLKETLSLDGLKYIRTIRKKPEAIYQGPEDFSKGYCLLRQGKDLVLACSGIMVKRCLEVADKMAEQGYSIGVIDVFRLKPLADELKDLLAGHLILTVENHNRIGGLGSAICELLAQENHTPVYRMGIDERFGQVGQLEYLLEEYQLTSSAIEQQVLRILEVD